MPAARLTRSALRNPLLLSVAFSLLMVQGLRVHFHSFADHDPLHNHSHAVELHVGGVPADPGHDDPDSEFGVATFAMLKIKTTQADAAPLAPVLTRLSLLPASRSARPPVALAPPFAQAKVQTPPLRAPPA